MWLSGVPPSLNKRWCRSKSYSITNKTITHQQTLHSLILISHHTIFPLAFILSFIDFLLHHLSIHLPFMLFTAPFVKLSLINLSLSHFLNTQEARQRGDSSSSSLFYLSGFIFTHTVNIYKPNLCSFDLLIQAFLRHQWRGLEFSQTFLTETFTNTTLMESGKLPPPVRVSQLLTRPQGRLSTRFKVRLCIINVFVRSTTLFSA